MSTEHPPRGKHHGPTGSISYIRVEMVVRVVSHSNLLELAPLHENDPIYHGQLLGSFKSGQATLEVIVTSPIYNTPLYP